MVEQAGVVRAVRPADEPTTSDVFVDISDRVGREGPDEGLLGFALSPDFAQTGRAYLHYTSPGGRPVSVVSRFVRDPLRAGLDPASEEVLLEVEQPYRNHNGGMLAFGPDGMLHVGLGDGGAAGDPHGHAQDLTTPLGAILRVDVSSRDGVRVPRDNPFVTSATGARPEILAYGFRDPWRFSFDRATGELWVGDVGALRQEVSVVERGGNHGWPAREGFDVVDEGVFVRGPLVAPLFVYGRELGASVTGGYVYRGERLPELVGAYVFGDRTSGHVWTLERDEAGGVTARLALRSGKGITSFGEDDDGELYVLSLDGAVSRVVAGDGERAARLDWPERLSDTGLFDVIVKRVMRADALAYDVDVEGWADGARVTRHVVLPDGARLGVRAQGAWDVPVGARLVQTLSVRDGPLDRPLETRVVERVDDGWRAATYVWRRSRRDADLVPEGRQFERRDAERGLVTWHAPSATECRACHHAERGFVLGLTSAQLGAEQVDAWLGDGLAERLDDAAAPVAPLSSPRAGETPTAARARAALAVQCAHCHRPDGPADASFDVRRDVPLDATGLVDARPRHGAFGLRDARLVAPGRPDASVVLHRMATLGDGRMPRLASQVVDEASVAAVRAWITEVGDDRR